MTGKSQEANEKVTPPTRLSRENVELVRDIGRLLLQFALVILIVFCIARPDIVRGWLSELGISKVTLFGMELTPAREQELATTVANLEQEKAQAIFDRDQARRQAETATTELARLGAARPNEASEINRIIQEIGPVPASSPPTVVPSQAQQTIVQSARESIGGQAQWAVVYGGDSTAQAAADEINWGRGRGLNVALVFRQSYYRSVAFATDAANASEILQTARTQRRRDAYIVNFSTWCANRERGEQFDTCR